MPKAEKTSELKYFQKLLEEVKSRKLQLSYLDEAREERTTEVEIRLGGLREFFEMRKIWSKALLICLIIILGFNIFLVILVGRGDLIYPDEWFLRIVLTTNLADILGLIFLVVKFLFKHPPARAGGPSGFSKALAKRNKRI